jgi:CBS domain containing-hemolysin-like protein
MIRSKIIHEELVGELSSHFENEELKISKTGQDSWLATGTLSLDELEEKTQNKFENCASTTLNGLFGELLGRIPVQGDIIEFNGLKMTALTIIDHRIAKVEIEKLKE